MLLVLIECFQEVEIIQHLDDESREKIDILYTKLRAHKHVRDYYCPWKFSIFGHHNNGRALAVSEAILQRDNVADVREILQDQKDLFEGKRYGNYSSLRFFSIDLEIDCPSDKKQGGFYLAILNALRNIDERPMARFQR